jgi:hypothetical protein
VPGLTALIAPERISERPPRGGLSFSLGAFWRVFAFGTKQTCCSPRGISAIGGKADIEIRKRLCETIHKIIRVTLAYSCRRPPQEKAVVFALVPYDVWVAAVIAVGIEWSAIVHHVGKAVVVAIMFELCT